MRTRIRPKLIVFLIGLNMMSIAMAQGNKDPVKIGVMTDMSSLFSDIGGRGSVIAA